MTYLPENMTSDMWLEQIFLSGEAVKGGVVKRQVRDVERLVGRQAFANEIRAVESGERALKALKEAA